jgi:hypothetical protein
MSGDSRGRPDDGLPELSVKGPNAVRLEADSLKEHLMAGLVALASLSLSAARNRSGDTASFPWRLHRSNIPQALLPRSVLTCLLYKEKMASHNTILATF